MFNSKIPYYNFCTEVLNGQKYKLQSTLSFKLKYSVWPFIKENILDLKHKSMTNKSFPIPNVISLQGLPE